MINTFTMYVEMNVKCLPIVESLSSLINANDITREFPIRKGFFDSLNE